LKNQTPERPIVCVFVAGASPDALTARVRDQDADLKRQHLVLGFEE